jgi:hypothetical protein
MFSPRFAARRVTVVVAAFAFVSQLAVVPARAESARETAASGATAATVSIAEAARGEAAAIATAEPRPRFDSGRTAAMMPLYVATAALQVLDAYSTMNALENGAREANPLMTGIASNKAALFGVKAAVASSTILAMHRMSKRNRVAAIVTGIAINSAYAVIVAHNYRVANRMQ